VTTPLIHSRRGACEFTLSCRTSRFTLTSSFSSSTPRRRGTRFRRPLARSWNTPLARGAYWWRVRPWAKWLNCGSWRPAASGFDRAEQPYKQEVAGSSPAPPTGKPLLRKRREEPLGGDVRVLRMQGSQLCATLANTNIVRQSYEGASMSLRSSLYRSARLLGDVQAVASGNPKRITRRAKNNIVGRALGRSGFWRFLWR